MSHLVQSEEFWKTVQNRFDYILKKVKPNHAHKKHKFHAIHAKVSDSLATSTVCSSFKSQVSRDSQVEGKTNFRQQRFNSVNESLLEHDAQKDSSRVSTGV